MRPPKVSAQRLDEHAISPTRKTVDGLAPSWRTCLVKRPGVWPHGLGTAVPRPRVDEGLRGGRGLGPNAAGLLLSVASGRLWQRD